VKLFTSRISEGSFLDPTAYIDSLDSICGSFK
jgi:hypothetical protein